MSYETWSRRFDFGMDLIVCVQRQKYMLALLLRCLHQAKVITPFWADHFNRSDASEIILWLKNDLAYYRIRPNLLT